MLYHGSQAGAFDLKTVVLESVTSMRRAGIDNTCYMMMIRIVVCGSTQSHRCRHYYLILHTQYFRLAERLIEET